MSLELWEKSSEDVRERWRDIARILRNADDAEEVPRALQTAFWFGFEAGSTVRGPRTEGSLLNLLPPDVVAQILKKPVHAGPTAPKLPPGQPERRSRLLGR